MSDLIIYPVYFVICRIIAAAAIWILAKKDKPSPFFILIFLFGFATDVIDGMIARQFHTGSAIVATMDGVADVSLYAATLLYLKKFFADIIRAYYVRLRILVLGQLVAWGVCVIKFGHISSWHSYMAKIFGLTIISSVVAVAVFRNHKILKLLLIVGMIYLIDDVAITLVMPHWRIGVMSVFDAFTYTQATLTAH